MQTKDVSTSSAGTLTVPALTAPAVSGGLAPALPPGALVGRGVAQTLQTLADAHNAVHGSDRKKRADVRAMRAAYRRGAGRKPRKGRTRRQEGLARVQAHLAALAGKALPVEYADDRVLLPGEEKRLAVLAVEGTVAEPLEHLKALLADRPADRPPAEPERKAEPAPVETKTWSDEARAAALAARRSRALSLPRDKRATSPLPNGRLAKHEDGSYGKIEHVTVGSLRAGDRLIHPTTGKAQGTVTSVRWGPGFTREADHATPLGAERQVHVDGKPQGVMGMGARYTRLGKEPEPSLGDLPVGELSKIAHRATQDVQNPDHTTEQRIAAHEDARAAHLAAASEAKLGGDEKAALEHLSLADHHRDAAQTHREDAAEHHFPIGSRVAAPGGKEGQVLAHGANGTAVQHDDGTVAVHKPTELAPGSDNTLRGTVAAHEAKPGDFVWDSEQPDGGYRVATAHRTGDTVHHTFEGRGGTDHRYHHADAQLRIVRGADAPRR